MRVLNFWDSYDLIPLRTLRTMYKAPIEFQLVFFCSADDDHDEKLTIDEIVSKHDVFVGSEATDYGDHLHRAKIIDEL